MSDIHNDCHDCNGSGWNTRTDNDCSTCNGSGIAQTAEGLVALIRIASDPTQPPRVYRPARFNAYRLTRRLVREAIASTWREDLRRSAEPMARGTDLPYLVDGVWTDPTNARWSTE
jgi:hypothetical protein